MIASQERMRILVADDYELARYGLQTALKDQGFNVISEVENGLQAVKNAITHKPDVIVMDLDMPVMNGIVATREIKKVHPEIRIIILTSHQDREEVSAAIGAGADAYCMKNIRIDRLAQVIEMVMDGILWIDQGIANFVREDLSSLEKNFTMAREIKKYQTDLTEREKEVLKLIVDGNSNKEISDILGITVHTAKAHVCNIIQKMAVEDRTQAAVKALQEGIIALV